MSILNAIVEKKKERLAAAKTRSPLASLRSRAEGMAETRPFGPAIRRVRGTGIRVITEIKKASPSKGLIRKDFDPVEIARIYESKQAAAISVLTEEDFFQGSLDYIPLVKDIVTLPLLRKDFIFDEYQIMEARAYGADAILLIAAILEKGQSRDYMALAGELGLDVLFEVHTARELDAVLNAGAPIIGVNNRNLRTLDISLNTTLDLLQYIPPDRIIVSESGITTPQEVELFEKTRVDAVLVGTSLIKQEDIGKAFDSLFHESAGRSI